MPELVIISGKGGTGKTSVVGGLAALADSALLVDCDVETPDLHIVLRPEIRERRDFVGGETALLRRDQCIGCGRCAAMCRFDAIRGGGPPTRLASETYLVDPLKCEGCRVCAQICPAQAVEMVPAFNGEWYVSDTRFGPFVHARLKPGRGTSGKLVTLLRSEARQRSEAADRSLIICDGVPGAGCPVIASVRGADLALIVTEPSVSGLHDFQRAAELLRHFEVPAMACVNKADVAPDVADQLERAAYAAGVETTTRIPYDKAVVAAQMSGRTIIEQDNGPAAAALCEVWAQVQERLRHTPRHKTARSPQPGSEIR